MAKSLQEMTLVELWELFPVVLVPHNPLWKDWARAEMEFLVNLLSDYRPKIHHIGSTSIPDIHAKPIVDILVELPTSACWDTIKLLMESNGYICMSQTASRMGFNKGYTKEGYAERVFHIHFHRIGDNAEIAFRDYLISHPDVARQYERLKLSLLPQFRNDRDGYTASKTDFVNRIAVLAKSRKSDA